TSSATSIPPQSITSSSPTASWVCFPRTSSPLSSNACLSYAFPSGATAWICSSWPTISTFATATAVQGAASSSTYNCMAITSISCCLATCSSSGTSKSIQDPRHGPAMIPSINSLQSQHPNQAAGQHLKITVSNAVAQAYTLGTIDKYKNVALYFARIFCRLSESPKTYSGRQQLTTWNSLLKNLLPTDLVRFLSMVMAGKEDMETNEKMKHLVFSIGQDLCRAVSEGEWKLPKHILLCVTILFEAQLVTSGSLKGVLSGKAYAKSLFCLKTVCESMERLLMERFIEEESVLITDPAALLNMTQSCNREHLDEALKDSSTSAHLGKTAALWMSFITHCHLVFMLLHSVKTNNIQLFHKCNGEMANIFFAFDGHNYSRYLTWLEVYLTNLENTHPGAKDLLSKGAIAVARSMIPGAISAVDKTMEETWLHWTIQPVWGIPDVVSNNLHTGTWTSSKTQTAGKHRELEKAEVKKGEEAIQRTIETIRNFTNPFTISDKDRLYSLASGALVLMEVEMDVLQAETVGKAAKAEFIKRLQSREPGRLFDPIKKQTLKTMETCNKKVTLTSSQGKQMCSELEAWVSLLALASRWNNGIQHPTSGAYEDGGGIHSNWASFLAEFEDYLLATGLSEKEKPGPRIGATGLIFDQQRRPFSSRQFSQNRPRSSLRVGGAPERSSASPRSLQGHHPRGRRRLPRRLGTRH
ncbi:hypothetical protein F7725_028761, partial [Dissostichus mawsoni]